MSDGVTHDLIWDPPGGRWGGDFVKGAGIVSAFCTLVEGRIRTATP
jgi:hypothetical protein